MTDDVPIDVAAPTGDLPIGRVWALALLAAVSPLATGMCLPALPGMRVDLAASTVGLQLTTTAFLIGLAVGQLVLGAISDRVGRRRPLVSGGIAFVLASVVCTVAPTLQVLVAARFVQGFAGAAGIVLGRAIIADLLEGAAAARAFALLMTIGAIGPVVAPLLGSVLFEVGGWRSVFVGLTVVGLAMLIAVVLVLPETLLPSRRTVGAVGAGVPEAARLLRRRSYVGNTLVIVLAYAGLIGYVAASPFVLQSQYGLTPLEYAVVFATNALGLTVGSFVVARVVRRAGTQRLLRTGLVVQLTVAGVLLALTLLRALPLPLLLVLLWLSVASLSLIAGNATSLALAGLSRGIGSGSAVLGAAQFGVAAAVAPIVGIAGPDALLPMAAVLVVAPALALAASLTLSDGAPSRRIRSSAGAVELDR